MVSYIVGNNSLTFNFKLQIHDWWWHEPMTSVTAFVEGWDFVQTLGEGAYGEWVQNNMGWNSFISIYTYLFLIKILPKNTERLAMNNRVTCLEYIKDLLCSHYERLNFHSILFQEQTSNKDNTYFCLYGNTKSTKYMSSPTQDIFELRTLCKNFVVLKNLWNYWTI